MKKAVIIVLALCLLAMTGCQADYSSADVPEQATINEQKANPQETLVDWGITMTVINATPTGCTLEVTRSGGNPTGEVVCGVDADYFMQSLAEDGWHNVKMMTDGYTVPAIALIVSEDHPRNFNLSWEKRYGILPSGTYRIAKTFLDDSDKAHHFSQSFVIE